MEGQGKKDIREMATRAKLFLDNNLRAFIIDNQDNYYFCYIKEANDALLRVHSFAGKRAGQNDDLLLLDIKEIKLYKEKI